MRSFRWESHGHVILRKVAEFYRKEVNTDCIFAVENRKVRAHKVILCACSNYFQEIFKRKPGEEEIALKNIKFQDLKGVLNFLYFGLVEIPENQVASFIKTAELFQIKELFGVNEPQNMVLLQAERDDTSTEDTSVHQNSVFRDRGTPSPTIKMENLFFKEESHIQEDGVNGEDSPDDPNLHLELEWKKITEKDKETILLDNENQEMSFNEDGGPEIAPAKSRELKEIKRRPRKKVSFICSLSNNSSPRKRKLKDTLLTHNKGRSLSCDDCSATFSQKGNLDTHRRIHTGERPYKCEECPSSFYSSSHLKRHRRVHTGDKPYVCNICSNSFTDSGHLKIHKRKHTGEKPYVCDVCSLSFSESSTLKCHKRTHTGDKPYICEICSSAFARSNTLSRHRRIHTGEKPYVCNVCSSSFTQLSNLKVHQRVHVR